MTLATMADRTLPLAERVQAALLCWDMDDSHEAARAALLADITAADRLARAVDAYHAGLTPWRIGERAAGDSAKRLADEMYAALDAYRARMQGVTRG